MKYSIALMLAIIASAQYSSVHASDANLVLLTVSKHIGDVDANDFNELNWGVGIEATEDTTGLNLTIGGYIYRNSYYKPSLMVSVAKHVQLNDAWTVGVGVAIANNYADDTNAFGEGLLASPKLSVQYKFIRIETTAPTGYLVDTHDVINLQLIFKIKQGK